MTLKEKEIQILKEIRNGNTAAYMDLVMPFKERLLRKALSMVKDPDDAEDIVQDSIISGYRSIANFRAESGVYTWLYRIVINKSKDFITKRNKNREKPLGEADYQVSDSRMGIEKNLELSDESRYLIEKINKLDETLKKILELRFYEEMSYSEIGEVLGMNVGTVKSKLFKGKEILKQMILKDKKGEGYFHN